MKNVLLIGMSDFIVDKFTMLLANQVCYPVDKTFEFKLNNNIYKPVLPRRKRLLRRPDKEKARETMERQRLEMLQELMEYIKVKNIKKLDKKLIKNIRHIIQNEQFISSKVFQVLQNKFKLIFEGSYPINSDS